MNRRYLTAVTPLPDHVLQVDFVSGSRLLLDMKPYLDKIRFRPLADSRVWNSAVTNGIFVRFGDVELSHDEILSMAEQECYRTTAQGVELEVMDAEEKRLANGL